MSGVSSASIHDNNTKKPSCVSSAVPQQNFPWVDVDKNEKMIMFIRHAEDELYETRPCAPKFNSWHTKEVKAGSEIEKACIDPCLTANGIAALSSGLPEEERAEVGPIGYGGVEGGLWLHVKQFNPDIILSSPMTRSIQSALVAFDWSEAPILLHYGLKELKGDYTKGGCYPRGKASSRCMPISYLQRAVKQHPRSSGGNVDWCIMEDELEMDDWFNPQETSQSMNDALEKVRMLLMDRPEKRIAVFTHGGVLRKLLGLEIGHSLYAIVTTVTSSPNLELINQNVDGVMQSKLSSCVNVQQANQQTNSDSDTHNQPNLLESSKKSPTLNTLLIESMHNSWIKTSYLSPGTSILPPPSPDGSDILQRKARRRAFKAAYKAKSRKAFSEGSMISKLTTSTPEAKVVDCDGDGFHT